VRHEQITLLDLARAPAESHTPTFSSHLKTWELLPLSYPLVTPTTSTSVQDNIELTSSTRRRALLSLNQYKLPVFFLHTIRTPTHRHSLLVGARTAVSYTDRYNPNKIVHPSDGEAWTRFNDKHREKAAEAHNVRVALATDGFNPYGLMAASYTCWPMFVIPLNLPLASPFNDITYSCH
jgi:hypothetical protein